MRKVYTHTSKDGTVTFRVRYRHRGDSTSTTFRGPREDARKKATEFAKRLDAVGADEALAWLRAKPDDEHEPDATPTLDAWAATYIATRTGVTDGTRYGYERTYANTYGPLLGGKTLGEIGRADVALALNHLSTKGGRKGKGYSDKSIANAHLLLSSMLGEAVEEGVIAANPCRKIKLPRRTAHTDARMNLISEDEFEKLVTSAPEHYRPLIIALGGTGMRWGEAEALEVRDFDPKAKTLRISKAAKWDTSKSRRDVGPTKTRGSDRTVTLPDYVVETLEPLIKGRGRTARMFVATRGGPLNHKTFWSDAWLPACTKAGLIDPRPRIHDLRHSHASWLIAAGVPLPVIMARLGHSSIKVTVDTYGHLSPDIQRAAADVAQLVLTRRGALAAPAGRPALPGAAETA